MRARLLGVIGAAAIAFACAQSDAGITTSVKNKLIADDTVKARQIDVDTRDRIVTLTGEVRSVVEESRALEIARSTKGVSNVVDNLTIVEETAPTAGIADPDIDRGTTETGTDAGITSIVKTKLLADPDVGGLKIDVDTRNGVVTLTGTVHSQAEKAHALEIARKSNGVTSVTDRLTVRARP